MTVRSVAQKRLAASTHLNSSGPATLNRHHCCKVHAPETCCRAHHLLEVLKLLLHLAPTKPLLQISSTLSTLPLEALALLLKQTYRRLSWCCVYQVPWSCLALPFPVFHQQQAGGSSQSWVEKEGSTSPQEKGRNFFGTSGSTGSANMKCQCYPLLPMALKLTGGICTTGNIKSLYRFKALPMLPNRFARSSMGR